MHSCCKASLLAAITSRSTTPGWQLGKQQCPYMVVHCLQVCSKGKALDLSTQDMKTS